MGVFGPVRRPHVGSGLTLGFMSLSLVDLEVLAKAGQPQDRKNDTKILPVVKNQHPLLCTLLIGNSLGMEALPIFLDALLPSWGPILISVTLILAFGEIIPQAICSRYGLKVGAKMVVIVRLLLLVFFPISDPISKVGLELVPRDYDLDTASPFRRTDIISMILVYKAAQTFHLKPFLRWTPTLFQTTIKTSLKGATPKLVLELMNVKYLTLAHVKSHLQA